MPDWLPNLIAMPLVLAVAALCFQLGRIYEREKAAGLMDKAPKPEGE